ncbi:helix-turn-helix domain-containing protein [Streptomyces lavendulae]|uniref:helix-turn-helix domain-containing protein n=1 Tax=Streptomyces lavendulae TaxID=1914 RepID=UPI0033C81300
MAVSTRGTGLVSGFVLRTARESIPRSQEEMAELLGVGVGTYQGWESGRRPISNMRGADLLGLRRRLPTLGADPDVVILLDAAMDADRIIEAALTPARPGEPHPLSEWVHTRDTAHMIAWAVNGSAPPALRRRPVPARRGPVASAPQLTPTERAAFFSHLRDTAEAAVRVGGESSLLHRQSLYLLSYDPGPDAASWTAHALHARRGVLVGRGWTPHWAEARSTATALARLGDPQPLWDFIDRSMADSDEGEVANLNYWALWLGVIQRPQANDAFMRDREMTHWDPVTLLRGLVHGLHRAPGFLDLYAHTVWALLEAHPWLPLAARDLTRTLARLITQLLDGNGLSERSRRELNTVHYRLSEHQ